VLFIYVLLNPICELINVSQKLSSSIADVAERWLDLPNKISNHFEGFDSIIINDDIHELN
jgi:hypothetical protein